MDTKSRDAARAEELAQAKLAADGTERAVEEALRLRGELDTANQRLAERDTEVAALAAHTEAGDPLREERRGHLARALDALRRGGFIATVALFAMITGAFLTERYRPVDTAPFLLSQAA